MQLTAGEQAVAERDGQIDILKSKLSHAEARLAEAERTMQSNQQVISWLNKEVTEAQVGRSVCLSFCLSVFLSVCLSVCLSICLSV
jgi:translation initiation factor 2B subunit (eIF-2B alpha/beta/delta family)